MERLWGTDCGFVIVWRSKKPPRLKAAQDEVDSEVVIGVKGMVVDGAVVDVVDEVVVVVVAWLWKKSLRQVSSRWALLLCVSLF